MSVKCSGAIFLELMYTTKGGKDDEAGSMGEGEEEVDMNEEVGVADGWGESTEKVKREENSFSSHVLTACF